MDRIIEISNLTAQYDGETILEDISIDIYRNDITVILGKSGCGKTTLLKNILRLYQPSQGKIKVFGQDITGMEESDFDQILVKIGVLFQNGALLNSIKVWENVAIPLEQHTDLPDSIIKRLVQKKLEMVELPFASNLYPAQLSGGMRKRAALARAIAMDPLLLFGDEPSAGLDPVTSLALDNLLLKLREFLNMTLVIVTHELSSIRRIADRIIFLDKGKVIFQGKLKEGENSDKPEVQQFFNPTGRR
ncbi:MAG TPA: ATP-binding cassette domain-containing protein [bacterium]|nr:ATP-binding cassette domain-containing protein [bacterium]